MEQKNAHWTKNNAAWTEDAAPWTKKGATWTKKRAAWTKNDAWESNGYPMDTPNASQEAQMYVSYKDSYMNLQQRKGYQMPRTRKSGSQAARYNAIVL